MPSSNHDSRHVATIAAASFGKSPWPVSVCSSSAINVRDIARALDAQVVVEGSLVAEGTRVHADVRLVDTVVDRKSGSRQFSAEVSELRALQQRVAADVAAFIAPR